MKTNQRRDKGVYSVRAQGSAVLQIGNCAVSVASARWQSRSGGSLLSIRRVSRDQNRHSLCALLCRRIQRRTSHCASRAYFFCRPIPITAPLSIVRLGLSFSSDQQRTGPPGRLVLPAASLSRPKGRTFLPGHPRAATARAAVTTRRSFHQAVQPHCY